jgi:Uma2 family endonuclease
VIEVADTTLAEDRGEKTLLYAEAGIPEYWIVNLVDDCVEVHRNPQGGHYQSRIVYHPGDEMRPLPFPNCTLNVSSIIQAV